MEGLLGHECVFDQDRLYVWIRHRCRGRHQVEDEFLGDAFREVRDSVGDSHVAHDRGIMFRNGRCEQGTSLRSEGREHREPCEHVINSLSCGPGPIRHGP
jgi:hypothetical protein